MSQRIVNINTLEFKENKKNVPLSAMRETEYDLGSYIIARVSVGFMSPGALRNT